LGSTRRLEAHGWTSNIRGSIRRSKGRQFVHPPLDKTEREPERKHPHGEFFEISMDFGHATTYNDDYKNEVHDGIDVYKKIIEPIINSFVHQTSWAEDVRRFSKVAEAWMDSVKSLGVDFFNSEGFSDMHSGDGTEGLLRGYRV
jgi:hypothetical protein